MVASTDRAKLERRVVETAMRDHMRMRNRGYHNAAWLGGTARSHWLACAALAKVLGKLPK